MKVAPKIITIVFLAITGFFTVHQIAVGNPFRDPVPPALTLAVFFLIGGFCTFYVFAHAK
jgi:hypothetical protein